MAAQGQPPSAGLGLHQQHSRSSLDREATNSGLQPPPAPNGVASSVAAMSFAPRGSSLSHAAAPGSFSSELRSQMVSSRAGSRLDISSVYPGGGGGAGIMGKVHEEGNDYADEQRLLSLKDKLSREMKIKEGSENMLEALNVKKAKQTRDQRQRVEAELTASSSRIRELRQKISDAQQMRSARPSTPIRQWTQENNLSNGPRDNPSPTKSAAESDIDESSESPSFALAELLQALEVEGMMPEYYVSRANQLVGLFKRHPTIKYDLVWSIFGMRMQMMLLSESREVVAAGYRVTRYAISDRASLQKIRDLNTDFLVVRYVSNSLAFVSVASANSS